MARYFTPASDKRKGVALFLCLFLGILGFHQFYVGRIGSGILYFCTCGLFFFGVIADLIKILNGSFRDNMGMPLREW